MNELLAELKASPSNSYYRDQFESCLYIAQKATVVQWLLHSKLELGGGGPEGDCGKNREGKCSVKM